MLKLHFSGSMALAVPMTSIFFILDDVSMRIISVDCRDKVEVITLMAIGVGMCRLNFPY